jgi:hypothetical protein
LSAQRCVEKSRNWVKIKASPEASAQRTGTIRRCGSFALEFIAAI